MLSRGAEATLRVFFFFPPRAIKSMSDRRPFVAGNWKLNGSRTAGRALVSAIGDGLATLGLGPPALAATDSPVEVLVCPPYVYLGELAAPTSERHLKLGAQDVAVGRGPGESRRHARYVGCHT